MTSSASALDYITPDILVSLIRNPYMTQRSYIDLVKSNSRLEDISLTNGPFLAYLKRFQPKKFDIVVSNLNVYRQKLLDVYSKSNYFYYDVYLDQIASEEDVYYYGLTLEEYKEAKLEEKYQNYGFNRPKLTRQNKSTKRR